MLALVLTLILALYILGPDVFSRLIIGSFAPARTRNRNRSEEIARAIVVSAVPITFVYVIAHYGFGRFSNISVLKNFLLGLYGDKSLEDHSDAFFTAAETIIRVNAVFLLAVYAVVLLWSLQLGYLIKNYGRYLRNLDKQPKRRDLLTWLVRPWVAEWHLKLSDTLLPKKSDYIRLDVLTKLNILYRGTLAEHHLDGDGALVSVTLTNAKKFKREELLADRAAAPGKLVNTALYWSPIEARSFVIMASEIVTLNLNYVDPLSLEKTPRLTASEAKKLLEVAAMSKSSRSKRPISPSRKQDA